ncbi:MAG: hypothetical protein PHI55_12100 [Burkholderiaceae bacterium]|nr:hypothetical protein [Burkholderiaceae bacterium]
MLRQHPSYRAIQEAFPHVAAKLQEHWGTATFLEYMDETLYNKRPELRQGFPQPVLLALQTLAETHDQLHPELVQQDGFWVHVEARRNGAGTPAGPGMSGAETPPAPAAR